MSAPAPGPEAGQQQHTGLGRLQLLLLLSGRGLRELFLVAQLLERVLLLSRLRCVLLLERLHRGRVLLALRIHLARQTLHRCRATGERGASDPHEDEDGVTPGARSRAPAASSEWAPTVVALLLQRFLRGLAFGQLCDRPAPTRGQPRFASGTRFRGVGRRARPGPGQAPAAHLGLQLRDALLEGVDAADELADLLFAGQHDPDELSMGDRAPRPRARYPERGRRIRHTAVGRGALSRGAARWQTALNKTAVKAKFRRAWPLRMARVETNWRQLRFSASRTTARARSSSLSAGAGRKAATWAPIVGAIRECPHRRTARHEPGPRRGGTAHAQASAASTSEWSTSLGAIWPMSTMNAVPSFRSVAKLEMVWLWVAWRNTSVKLTTGMTLLSIRCRSTMPGPTEGS